MKTLELPLDDEYVPSDGELNNFVYLTCKYTVGWGMRQADLAVCLMMARTEKSPIKGNAGLSYLCEVACEYLWDHICGEPDEPTAETLFDHIKPVLQQWYATSTVEARAETE